MKQVNLPHNLVAAKNTKKTKGIWWKIGACKCSELAYVHFLMGK